MWQLGTRRNTVRHDFSDRWLVQWALDGEDDDTWEPFEVLKDVETFHTHCAAHGMSTLFSQTTQHSPA